MAVGGGGDSAGGEVRGIIGWGNGRGRCVSFCSKKGNVKIKKRLIHSYSRDQRGSRKKRIERFALGKKEGRGLVHGWKKWGGTKREEAPAGHHSKGGVKEQKGKKTKLGGSDVWSGNCLRGDQFGSRRVAQRESAGEPRSRNPVA